MSGSARDATCPSWAAGICRSELGGWGRGKVHCRPFCTLSKPLLSLAGRSAPRAGGFPPFKAVASRETIE